MLSPRLRLAGSGVLIFGQPNVVKRFPEVNKFTWVSALRHVQHLRFSVVGVGEVEDLRTFYQPLVPSTSMNKS